MVMIDLTNEKKSLGVFLVTRVTIQAPTTGLARADFQL
jgi:hypothetical protein